MQKIRFVNGNGTEIDLTSGNYGITAISGLSNTNLSLQTQQVPDNDGSVYIDGLLDNRTIDITLAINDDNDLKKRYQLRRELISALNPKLGEGYLYYKNDFLERRIKVIPNAPVIKNKNSNEKGTVKASLSFTACGVYWEDVEETVVELNSFEEKTVVNNGDVPCGVKIEGYNVHSPFTLINATHDKKIRIKDGITGIISLNTNLGEKQVIESHLVEKQLFAEYTDINAIIFNSILNLYLVVDSYNVFVYSNFSSEFITFSSNDILRGGFFDSENGKVYIYDAKGLYSSSDCKTWFKEEINDVKLRDVYYATKENGFFVISYKDSNITTYVGTDLNNLSEVPDSKLAVYVGRMANSLNKDYVIIYDEGSYSMTNDFVSFSTTSMGLNRVKSFGCNGSILLIDDPNEEDSKYGLYYTTRLNGTGTTWEPVVQDATIDRCFYSEVTNKFYYLYGANIYNSDDCTSWGSELCNLGIRGVLDINELNMSLVWESNSIEKTENFSDFETLIQNDISFSYAFTKNICVTNERKMLNIVYNRSSNDGIAAVMEYEPNFKTFNVIANIEHIYIRNAKFLEGLDKFVILANSAIYLSSDGIDWEKITVNYNYNDCIYVNGKFVAVGENGYIITSSDMVEFSYYRTPSYVELFTVAYNNEYYIGSEDGYFTSLDFSSFPANGLGHSYKNAIVHKESVFFVYDNSNIVKIKNSIPTIYTLSGGFGTIYGFYYSKYLNSFVITFQNVVVYIKDFQNGLWTATSSTNKVNCIDYKYNLFAYGNELVSIMIKDETNIISKLSVDSDMNFNLETGSNEISITGQIDGVYYLTYRQKYLGV